MELKPTAQVAEALALAQRAAQTAGHPEITPDHLTSAIVQLGTPQAEALFQAAGTGARQALKKADSRLRALPSTSGAAQAPGLGRDAVAVLQHAHMLMTVTGDTYLALDLLLVALAETGHLAAVEKCGATDMKAKMDDLRGGRRATRVIGIPAQTSEAMLQSGTDLTQMAHDGRLDPVIGRDAEIRRVVQVLSRRTKNNPILIGEPGVGKTAVVEALAQRIVECDVPESLRHTRVVALDLGAMVVGAKYRDEFGERLKAVFEEIRASDGRSVLALDLHEIARSGYRRLGIIEQLERALAARDVQCLATVTPQRWRQISRRYPDLAKRLSVVALDAPSVEMTVSMLRGLKERYEAHHMVMIEDAALVAAASLSDRYIAGRQLPDKAIDLVDETASRLRMEIDTSPVEIDELRRTVDRLKMEELQLQTETDDASRERLEARWDAERSGLSQVGDLRAKADELRTQADRCERDGDHSGASRIRFGELPALETELALVQGARYASASTNALVKERVGRDDIVQTMVDWTGVPAHELRESAR